MAVFTLLLNRVHVFANKQTNKQTWSSKRVVCPTSIPVMINIWKKKLMDFMAFHDKKKLATNMCATNWWLNAKLIATYVYSNSAKLISFNRNAWKNYVQIRCGPGLVDCIQVLLNHDSWPSSWSFKAQTIHCTCVRHVLKQQNDKMTLYISVFKKGKNKSTVSKMLPVFKKGKHRMSVLNVF